LQTIFYCRNSIAILKITVTVNKVKRLPPETLSLSGYFYQFPYARIAHKMYGSFEDSL